MRWRSKAPESYRESVRHYESAAEPRGDTKGRCQSATGRSAYSMFQIAGTSILITEIYSKVKVFLVLNMLKTVGAS